MEIAKQETQMIKRSIACAVITLVLPYAAVAQEHDSTAMTAPQLTQSAERPSNVQAPAAQTQASVELAVRRFRVGVSGGVGFDPELIDFGAHGAFGPIFTPAFEFRPGVEFGLGELTTMFGINLDVLYMFPGTAENRWMPYLGAGPNFALSHRDLNLDDDDEDDDGNRFDFSDTDFEGGFNFIAGARNPRGLFFELKATAGGVTNVRLLAGFNF
jgi:hypothetical protein